MAGAAPGHTADLLVGPLEDGGERPRWSTSSVDEGGDGGGGRAAHRTGQTAGVPGAYDVDDQVLMRLRAHCTALPEVEERLSHGSPAFFVRGKKTFVMFVDDHHGDGILGFWCAAPLGVQGELVDAEPQRFFIPPYVGHRGWLGVRLDVDVDWGEIGDIVTDAYCQVAPKVLLRQVRPEA